MKAYRGLSRSDVSAALRADPEAGNLRFPVTSSGMVPA